MASDCKLCALLGSTPFVCVSESVETHNLLHARQSNLINLLDGSFDKELTLQNGTNPEATKKRFPKQKSEVALSAFCQTLIKSCGKSCDIRCSQCKNSIKSYKIPSATADSLINHACVHLNMDLFACRHCDLKFVSKSGIRCHLRKVHGLGHGRANYFDTIVDHQNEITDMVKLCFGKAPQKQLKVTEFGKQKRNNPRLAKAPFSELIYDFLANFQPGDHIQCHLCPRSIHIIHHRSRTKKMLLEHARWHLGKPIFSCHLCQYSASTQGTIASHLKEIHSVAKSTQNFHDGSSEYVQEISSLLDDCFGAVKKEILVPQYVINNMNKKRARRTNKIIWNRRGTSSLQAERQLRCSELAQRFQQSGKLQCRICPVKVAILYARQANYVAAPMRHALVHFNKILFTCRRCSYTSTTKHAMGQHVRSKHAVPVRNEFDDCTDDFHNDFMDMLSKCFDWDLEPERSEGSISSPIAIRKNHCFIASRMYGNDLKSVRHIHAHELIRNHASNGKIICRICSHSTTVSAGVGSKLVFQHAMAHLDRRFWQYQCKLCSHTSVYRGHIRNHVKRVHKNKKDAGEFEDMSDKYHTKIMNIVSTCYDWSVESGKVS